MKNLEQATVLPKSIKFVPLLPYWAVLQADFQQTFRSWLYRAWVLLSVAVAVGYFLYRYGAYREAGLIQPAAEWMSDALRWSVLGSITLLIILTAGSISAERGTLADSVLSRGISRYQYFMGKWHARLLCLLGTYFLSSGIFLGLSYFLLKETSWTLTGCVFALLVVGSFLMVVITAGVTASALFNNTLLGVAVVWVFLYGLGYLLSFLPDSFPAPDRALRCLPCVLNGMYDMRGVMNLILCSIGVSVFIASIGMLYFGKKDV